MSLESSGHESILPEARQLERQSAFIDNALAFLSGRAYESPLPDAETAEVSVEDLYRRVDEVIEQTPVKWAHHGETSAPFCVAKGENPMTEDSDLLALFLTEYDEDEQPGGLRPVMTIDVLVKHDATMSQKVWQLARDRQGNMQLVALKNPVFREFSSPADGDAAHLQQLITDCAALSELPQAGDGESF